MAQKDPNGNGINTNPPQRPGGFFDSLRRAEALRQQQQSQDATTDQGEGIEAQPTQHQEGNNSMSAFGGLGAAVGANLGLRDPESQVQRLTEENAALRQQCADLQQTVEEMLAPPFFIGTVLNVGQQTALVATEGRLVELIRRDGLDGLTPGQTVRLHGQTQQIIDLYEDVTTLPGDVVIVKRLIEEPAAAQAVAEAATDPTATEQAIADAPTEVVAQSSYAEVEIGGNSHVVFIKAGLLVKQGDRVALDQSHSIIVQNYGQESGDFESEIATVTWDEIGGLDDAKDALRAAVEWPTRHADLYSFYGQPVTKGILLHGPPGCGKTMLGKAAARGLADVHGVNPKDGGFIYVKATQFLQKYVGVGEEMIRSVFRKARKFREEHNYPAVIFIDEADAVMKKRGSGVSTDVYDTLVAAFLSEMDGMETNGAIVILATNRQDMIDNAILRDERVSVRIYISRPDREKAKGIFRIHFAKGNVPLANGLTLDEATEIAASELFNPERLLYEGKIPNKDAIKVTLGDLCNGAMCKGIVDTAVKVALKRDVAAAESGNPTPNDQRGVRREDIVEAIDSVLEQNYSLNREEEAKEVIANHPDKQAVTSIRRWTPTKGKTATKAKPSPAGA